MEKLPIDQIYEANIIFKAKYGGYTEILMVSRIIDYSIIDREKSRVVEGDCVKLFLVKLCIESLKTKGVNYFFEEILAYDIIKIK